MTDRPPYELQPTTALPDEPIVTTDWKLPEPRKFSVLPPYPFWWHFSWRDERSCGFWFRIWGYGLRVSTEGVEVLKP